MENFLGQKIGDLKILKSAELSIARATAQHEPPILPVLHIRNDKSVRLGPRPRFRQGEIDFVFVLARILRLTGREMSPQLFLQVARMKLCLVPFLQEEEDR